MAKDKPDVMMAVDILLFGRFESGTKILLVKRKYEPFRDRWAIPGGRMEKDEPLDSTAARELYEETNIKDIKLERLEVFDRPDRDPRGRTISLAYYALVEPSRIKPRAGSDAKELKWFDLKRLPDMAFDHKDIIKYAKSTIFL